MNVLEQNIVNKTKEHLARLEELVANKSDYINPQDINTQADYLFSLIDLCQIDDHGMSEATWSSLNQMNIRALHVLRNR